MTEHDPQTQLASLVDAFLCCMGQLMLICDHMTRYPGSDDADPAPVVLRRLLCDILASDLAHRTADCATVTRVINEISARIDSDLRLVDPSRRPPGRPTNLNPPPAPPPARRSP
jgi:hypothetical protein